MIILPHLGLHELDRTFILGPDAGKAEAAGASKTVESLRSSPAVMEHDVLIAIVLSVAGDGHLPRGRADAEELSRSPIGFE